MVRASVRMPVQRGIPSMSPVTELVHVDASALTEASGSPCSWCQPAIQFGWPSVVIAPLLLESFDLQ